MNINKNVGRRKFLGDCGKMTGIGAMSSVINLQMMSNVAAQNAAARHREDYKAVVCLFMDGGNDSFNMLLPGNRDYSDYRDLRRQISIPRAQADRLVDRNGQDQHLHAGMNGVRTMFNNGDLSFVCNVGTLTVPDVNRNNVRNRQTPRALGSHFDQTRQWQNSVTNLRGGSLAATGWVGRMSEILADVNDQGSLNMNISTSGSSVLQTSIRARPLVLNGGANNFNLYENNVDIRRAVNTDLESTYSAVLANHYNQSRQRAIVANNRLAELEDIPFNTSFPNSALGRDLRQVATYIRASRELGQRRQTFFVRTRGHDAHRGVIGDLRGKMPVMSAALLAFNRAMREIGFHDNVLLYTASDFGRNLRSNGSGSGHGWGSNQIVMGGPVRGNTFIGSYPLLNENLSNQIIRGSGRVIPTMSIDELHASIAYWFGVENNGQMRSMLPNIRNFWQGGVSTPPVRIFTNAALQNRRI